MVDTTQTPTWFERLLGDRKPKLEKTEAVLFMENKLELYSSQIRFQVEGWVGDQVPALIESIDKTQRDLGVRGDIVEIGVHHGLFMLLLAAVRRDDEKVLAFDIFDRQELNIDHSGSGVRALVEGNIARFYPESQDAFIVRALDSMGVRSADLATLFPRPVRLFSVDGGHTKYHVSNDLNVAQEVVASGGVVMLDDFLGPHWPSVTEGFFHYMTTINRRLAPFLFFQNKLYLTTFSEHALISQGLRKHLDSWVGDEMHQGRWKYVDVAGFQVLSKG
jgi:hypothetical protein